MKYLSQFFLFLLIAFANQAQVKIATGENKGVFASFVCDSKQSKAPIIGPYQNNHRFAVKSAVKQRKREWLYLTLGQGISRLSFEEEPSEKGIVSTIGAGIDFTFDDRSRTYAVRPQISIIRVSFPSVTYYAFGACLSSYLRIIHNRKYYLLIGPEMGFEIAQLNESLELVLRKSRKSDNFSGYIKLDARIVLNKWEAGLIMGIRNSMSRYGDHANNPSFIGLQGAYHFSF